MRESDLNEALLQWLHGTVVSSVRQGNDELTMRQLAIMLVTYLDADLQTVRGLAETLRISRPAVSRALDRLGNFGLIRRQMDPRDRRSIVVRRTRKGAERIQQIRSIMREAPHADAILPSAVVKKSSPVGAEGGAMIGPQPVRTANPMDRREKEIR